MAAHWTGEGMGAGEGKAVGYKGGKAQSAREGKVSEDRGSRIEVRGARWVARYG